MDYNSLAISVTQLNNYVKQKLESDEYLQNVLVKGEISNYKHHYTGHLYFTLKDENALIKCVMFKSYAEKMSFEPQDGDKVIVLGSVNAFVRDGVYQIYAKAIKKEGIGDLHEKFEKLKAKLEKEGLFDEGHKKSIPFLPKVIGVLTASTGAVIRDIINVTTRRNPNCQIKLYPVPVQGEGAAEKIADGIKFMNENKICDVLIVGRGGGSLEDLWPFNEEIVAKAIYESEIPIISAVGHETDFTIADFVADLRAPTPSAAAELAMPNIEDVKYTLSKYDHRFKVGLQKKLEISKLRYEKCMKSRAFSDPMRDINEKYMLLDIKVKELQKSIKSILNNKNTEMVKLIAQLDALSPLKTLSRGYSITEKDGKVIKNAKDLKKDDEVNLRFSDGNKLAVIK